jgi:lipid II:glycine glycyltransferase (peptidoglycan interpeptide bridge formation enzyme)
MEHYLEDKIARNYRGPSPAFLRAMHGASSDKSPLVVLRALHGGKPVAGVLLVRHGRAATYQVGWTDERGRAVRAHHFLLWQSVLWLVKHGYIGFDLGGINEKTPGIARFKTRMGGKPFRLVGGYV